MRMNLIAVAESLNSRRLVPETEDVLNIIERNNDQELYTSLYTYQDRHLEQFKRTHSLSGITDVKTSRLFFDFDSGSNPHKAQQDTQEVWNRLMQLGVPDEKILIYFSGNKGFHIDVPITESLSRQEFVNIVFGIAGDLETFDVRINDEARIIRTPFSKHPVSGLHKIPLTYDDLCSANISEIKEYAKDIKMYDLSAFKKTNPINLTDELNVLKSKTYKKVGPVQLTEIKGFDVEDIDFTKCPRHMDPARFALQEGFFYGTDSVAQGERNISFLILAATYRSQGFSPEHALALLETTAEKQALRTGEDPYTTDQLQREIINAVFAASWRGGIYASDEPILQLTRQRFNLADVIEETSIEEITDVGDGFKSFARNLQKNRVLVGLPSLDEKLVITTGMVCTVVSAPGGGKTALSNLFAETVSKGDENVLYFSLDLYKNLLFGRMLQRHVSYDIQTILEQFESEEIDEELMAAYADVLGDYSNVGFSFKTTSVDDIEKEIQVQSKKKGKTPKLVIVDYLDKVKSPYSDPTQSSAYVVGRLSDIAKKYQTLVLLLAQPSKFGSSGPEQEFKSYRSLKGSSSIESDSRIVLGIHRPGYSASDQSNDKYSTLTILKNNTGSLGRLDYAWDGLAGTFTELTVDQRRDLKRLRDEIESQKETKTGWDI